MTGEWTSWDAEGRPLCQATFHVRSRPRFGLDFASQQSVRQGKAIWWSPAGDVVQTIEYEDDKRTQEQNQSRLWAEGASSGFALVSRDETLQRIDQQLTRGMFRERCDAIRRLRAMGQDGVPGLIKALDCPEEPIQRLVLSSLQWLGPKAPAAIPALTQMAEDSNLDRAIAALQALIEIDAAHRLEWMQRLFTVAVDAPVRADDRR